ncbi:unnamed protein product [Chondrus crispus]|uniref:Uncharacterized protein n=2 Tax=Chondrus crispus TaxID=2769 RepID=R7QAI1_CHOCR|nr:unnamed protein product [Chondrus crispus]CDF34808.1 unnamed protein product [Chondrus crispus]|eukprot:XP_005714627.1 unnamed protein product [Chondrus crispus]
MYQTCVCCGQVPCWRSVRKTGGGIFQTQVYFTSSEFVGKWKITNVSRFFSCFRVRASFPAGITRTFCEWRNCQNISNC